MPTKATRIRKNKSGSMKLNGFDVRFNDRTMKYEIVVSGRVVCVGNYKQVKKWSIDNKVRITPAEG